jgi:hypothetical protein
MNLNELLDQTHLDTEEFLSHLITISPKLFDRIQSVVKEQESLIEKAIEDEGERYSMFVVDHLTLVFKDMFDEDDPKLDEILSELEDI